MEHACRALLLCSAPKDFVAQMEQATDHAESCGGVPPVHVLSKPPCHLACNLLLGQGIPGSIWSQPLGRKDSSKQEIPTPGYVSLLAQNKATHTCEQRVSAHNKSRGHWMHSRMDGIQRIQERRAFNSFKNRGHSRGMMGIPGIALSIPPGRASSQGCPGCQAIPGVLKPAREEDGTEPLSM